MAGLLILIPLICSISLLLIKSRTFNANGTIGCAILYMIITGWLLFNHGYASTYFAVDNINTVFLFILAMLYLVISLYSLSYLPAQTTSLRDHTNFYVFLLLFIAAMSGALLSTHLALLWVFIEATTLTSAYLIYFNKTKSSLEAAWKYIFICSIGIAISYVGIILIAFAAGQSVSLYFVDLYHNARELNPFWLKLAFVFILVGFGTKTGLAPVHAWLPDAHSEAPSPISALLSGALLNTSFLAILRVFHLMTLADMAGLARTLLMIMGFMSVLVSAVFIMRAKNYKRMLAYSSIENMGIAALGISAGGIGVYAAMLHLVAHSFSKASLFLTSGNIQKLYHTKEIDQVSGIIKKDRYTAWLWVLSFASIIGLPPFPGFFSELLIIKALIQNSNWLVLIPFLLFLIIIVYGMGNSVLKMVFLPAAVVQEEKLDKFYYIAPALLITVLVIIGLYMPGFLYRLLDNAAIFMKG